MGPARPTFRTSVIWGKMCRPEVPPDASKGPLGSRVVKGMCSFCFCFLEMENRIFLMVACERGQKGEVWPLSREGASDPRGLDSRDGGPGL